MTPLGAINSAGRLPVALGPDCSDAYRHWRDAKLAAYPARSDDLFVEIDDLANPSEAEREAVRRSLRRANMAIYVCRRAEQEPSRLTQDLQAMASAFGLCDLERHRSAGDGGLVALEDAENGSRSKYIPYTNRALNWHTDGYYNAPDARIRAFLLHCARSSSSGGENGLLDPEIAYIRLRDISDDLVAALMRPDAMTIPANVEQDGTVRPASIGPVFSFEPEDGTLHMRYTARKRHVIWRDDAETRSAAAALLDLLTGGDDVIQHRLKPGEGLLCNNVLHNRSAFEDDPTIGARRLYLRARYANRIQAT